MRASSGVSMVRQVVCLLCLGLAVPPLTAAPAAAPSAPEPSEAILFQDSSGESLRPLPSENPVTLFRPGSFPPLGRARTEKKFLSILGAASSFRLKRGKELVFVVHCDKRDSFLLYAFHRRGETRAAKISTHQVIIPIPVLMPAIADLIPPWYITARSGGIPFEAKPTGDSSYRFVVRNLDPGEYGFVMASSFAGDDGVPDTYEVFDFAVDAK